MKTKFLALELLIALLAGCAPASRPAASVPPELTIEEHLLTRSPEAEYAQLYFAEKTQDEVMAKHADERTRFAGSGTPFCTVKDQKARCTRLGPDELSVWIEYGRLPFSTGKAIVAKNDKQIYSIGVGDSSPVEPLRGFGVVGDHWILETANVQTHQHGNTIDSEPVGQITVDGKLLNKQFGYEEAFGYQTLRGTPFYFFQRDGQIDISYNGVEIATGYAEVPHYGCCSAATLNPSVYQNMVTFFARKGSAWYYIEIGVFNISSDPS